MRGFAIIFVLLFIVSCSGEAKNKVDTTVIKALPKISLK